MFVVASASFQLLYVMIILAHDRRKIMRNLVSHRQGWAPLAAGKRPGVKTHE